MVLSGLADQVAGRDSGSGRNTDFFQVTIGDLHNLPIRQVDLLDYILTLGGRAGSANIIHLDDLAIANGQDRGPLSHLIFDVGAVVSVQRWIVGACW